MKYEASISTKAAPADLWAVVADVERWPDWIEVYEQVQRRDAGPLAIGSRARIKQKGLAPGEWVVTELVDGESFAWVNQQPGVRTVGSHRVHAEPGGSRLTLTIEQSGVLAGVVGWVFGRKTQRYIVLEGERLTAVAQSP